MLIYALCNTPPIRLAKPNHPSECIVGFVDDTLITTGKHFDETHNNIKDMMERTNGVFDWSRIYNSPLEQTRPHRLMHSQDSIEKSRPLALSQRQGDTHITY